MVRLLINLFHKTKYMNILNILRKPYFAIFLASLVLFVSCEQYDTNLDINSSKFDYSLFNTYKGSMLNINLNNVTNRQNSNSEITRLELNEALLNEINLQLGTNLDYSLDFKSIEIISVESIVNWSLQNNILDNKDVEILNDFSESLLSNDVENALSDLESKVFQSTELNNFKIEKYEELANTTKLIIDDDPNFFNRQESCIGAVIGLIFAFIALVLACGTVPLGGVTAPACYFAAANFIRASITVGTEC